MKELRRGLAGLFGKPPKCKETVTSRFTEALRSDAEKQAEKYDMTLSEYIRFSTQRQIISDEKRDQEIEDLMRHQQNRPGTPLNQLGHLGMVYDSNADLTIHKKNDCTIPDN
jgi:hypothetical protein